MKRLLARRPSPALVIACLALFLSLGGVSYGLATGIIDSREIRNNTIRTQDLRNNDIRSIDIRNSTIRGRDVALETLTGSDIKESKLGQVPSAATAGDASTLGGIGKDGFLRPGGPAFTALTLDNDWATVFGEKAPGFAKDPFEFVHLHGALQRTGAQNLAFALPASARPATSKRFIVYSEAGPDMPVTAGLRIEPNGEATLSGTNGALSTLVSLEGVTYRAGD